MFEIDDLWEEKPKNEKRRGRKKKPKKVKDTSVGFKIELGKCRRRGKKGKIVTAPILLAKDPLCWILRIGTHQTYPSSLSVVFETIAQEKALELNANASIEDLIEEMKTIEENIRKMGEILDKRIRKFIVTNSKK